MSKQRHTAGEWTQELDGSVVMGGQVVISCGHGAPDGAVAEESKANLRLISAAPDMLAAIEARLKCDEMFEQGTQEWHDSVIKADSMMANAIAKATA